MARRKPAAKPNKKQVRGRRRKVRPALLLAVLLVGGLFGWMRMGAEITHVRFAQVYLQDLPAAMDGTTLLYISDINIRSTTEAAACCRMMDKLSALNPDMLLLGGDYSAPTLLEGLNGNEKGDAAPAADFISSLAGFSAPLGKFAVLGEADEAAVLLNAFSAAGVQLLQDGCAEIERNGARLVIAGLSDASAKTTPYEQIGANFTGDECVLVLAHNPSAYIGVRVAEARGGGAWADMVLCGHTLGGQMRLFGRNLRSLSEEEARCISGWYYADDLPMLVSQGLGCRGAKLRLGTQSEVWMITLKRPSARQDYNLTTF